MKHIKKFNENISNIELDNIIDLLELYSTKFNIGKIVDDHADYDFNYRLYNHVNLNELYICIFIKHIDKNTTLEFIEMIKNKYIPTLEKQGINCNYSFREVTNIHSVKFTSRIKIEFTKKAGF